MTDKEIKQAALAYIKKYSLQNISYENLCVSVENEGYTIVEFALNTDNDVDTLINALNIRQFLTNTRGFTYADSSYRLIFIDDRLSEREKLLVLSHELGHIVCGHMGRVYVLGQDVVEEYEANLFSNSLLETRKPILKRVLFVGAAILMMTATASAAVLIISNTDSNNNGDKDASLLLETQTSSEEVKVEASNEVYSREYYTEETTETNFVYDESTSDALDQDVTTTLEISSEDDYTTEQEDNTEISSSTETKTEAVSTTVNETSPEPSTTEINIIIEPITEEATTKGPTTEEPTTEEPTTEEPTTEEPTTEEPTTEEPTTEETTTANPDFYIVDGVLLGYTGSGGCVEIPYGVTRIANDVFLNNTTITELIIPTSVKTIEWQAFKGCLEITKITVPISAHFNSNGPYGIEALDGCNKINTVKYINGEAYITNETNRIPVPEGQLTTIELASDLVEIPDYTFAGYEGDSVIIPDTCKIIGWGAFKDCKNLKSISLPYGITRIQNETFDGCTALTEIELPSSLVVVDAGAFTGCTIKKVTYCGSENKWYNIIYDSTRGSTILSRTIFSDSEILYSGSKEEFVIDERGVLTDYNGLGGEVIIPDNVKEIGNAAFLHCDNISTITIPSGVNSIGNYAFAECTGLYSISIPSTVKSIGAFAFARTHKLYSLTIPEGVERLGLFFLGGDYTIVSKSSAFSAVEKIYLPSTLKEIDSSFYCDDIYFSGAEDQWNKLTAGYSIPGTVHFE